MLDICEFDRILCSLTGTRPVRRWLIVFAVGLGVLHAVSQPAVSATLGQQSAVARIVVKERDGESFGSGTLVGVRDDVGLVVTNWHVIRDADGPITVQFPGGFSSSGRVLRFDRTWDLAALLIWKPNVNPMPVASQAPRPGDPLSIAGFGDGQFRLVTGQCTQYVSPGMSYPYEMLEVSVDAREGDSGGPVLNESGELAGVLFGATDQTTTGSYCGRVHWFLESVWPGYASATPSPIGAGQGAPLASPMPSQSGPGNLSPVPENGIAAGPIGLGAGNTNSVPGNPRAGNPVTGNPVTGNPAQAPRLPRQPSYSGFNGPMPIPDRTPLSTSGNSLVPAPGQGRVATASPQSPAAPIPLMAAEEEPTYPVSHFETTLDRTTVVHSRPGSSLRTEGETDFLNQPAVEHLKTFFALVGLISVILHVSSWFTRGRDE